MTDERETTTNEATPDDATSRVPTPSRRRHRHQAVPPTAPLTPPSPAHLDADRFEHEVAWASGPVPASPVVPPAKPPRKGGRRPLGGQPRGRRARRRADLGRGRGDHHRAVVDRGRPRLRPGRHHGIRGGPPRPARRPARRRRRIPVQVPGLRRPGRARHQARRGPRPAGQGRHQRRAVLHDEHQAVVRRRARVQRRPAAARAVRVERRSPVPRLVRERWPSSRSRTRRWPRRGSTQRSPRPAPRRHPRPTTARP